MRHRTGSIAHQETAADLGHGSERRLALADVRHARVAVGCGTSGIQLDSLDLPCCVCLADLALGIRYVVMWRTA